MMKAHDGHYGRFVVMIALHFVAMYILMYSMVNAFENVFNSLSQFYMAGLMTASMVLIEVPLMASMYKNKKLNLAILIAGTIALLGFFLAIRQQGAIYDRQFLRSMIPHHSGAILMCQQSTIQDAELKNLCASIVEGQQLEIDQMKAILQKLAE